MDLRKRIRIWLAAMNIGSIINFVEDRRQKANRERQRAGKAARLEARAQEAGVSVAEMPQRIKENKAEAAAARRAAEKRREILEEVEILLFECRRRGAVLRDGLIEQLGAIATRKGFREVGAEQAQMIIDEVTHAVEVLARANARRIRDAISGGEEMLQ